MAIAADCRLIATVKAFNTPGHELKALETLWLALRPHQQDYHVVGLTQFFTMTMFIQAFWYGSKLVREGHAPGEVTSI
jgi:ATP-binding cassette subfamily B (MDR/TAP) protein 1